MYFAVHDGIACLAFLTYDWSQLHAGIACLASLAYDWVAAHWDRLPVLLHAGIACLATKAYDWVVTNGCFNPINVNSIKA